MNASREKAWILLGLLLIIDLFFIMLHILALNHLIPGRQFSIERDGGFAEMFQYSKEAWLALVLVSVALLKPQRVYWAWAAFFTFLLLDDAFQIHENGGAFVQHVMNIKPILGLRAQDFGEMVIYGVSGIFFLAWISIAYFASEASARQESVYIGLLVCALFFCGVVVDMLHVMAGMAGLSWYRVLGILEDGGEMLVLSTVCMVVYSLATAKGLQGFLALDWLLEPLQGRFAATRADTEEDALGIG